MALRTKNLTENLKDKIRATTGDRDDGLNETIANSITRDSSNKNPPKSKMTITKTVENQHPVTLHNDNGINETMPVDANVENELQQGTPDENLEDF